MKAKVLQLSKSQYSKSKFRIIALTALVTTAVIWASVSMNLLWTAVGYFGFLLFIGLIYGTIDHMANAVKADERSR